MENKKKQLIKSIVIAVAAALYLISPIDVIPDAFLGFGQMDDLAIALLAVGEGVKAWRLYKGNKSEKESAGPDGGTGDTKKAEAIEETIEVTDYSVHDGE